MIIILKWKWSDTKQNLHNKLLARYVIFGIPQIVIISSIQNLTQNQGQSKRVYFQRKSCHIQSYPLQIGRNCVISKILAQAHF